MKVRELQDQLSKLNPELDVLCYTEDAELVATDYLFKLLEIEYVDTVDAQKVRGVTMLRLSSLASRSYPKRMSADF